MTSNGNTSSLLSCVNERGEFVVFEVKEKEEFLLLCGNCKGAALVCVCWVVMINEKKRRKKKDFNMKSFKSESMH